MADEEGMDVYTGKDGWVGANNLEDDTVYYTPAPDIIPNAYSRYPLERLVQAAYDGDLELLQKLLDREDPVNGYHHDLNEHLETFNALHAAAYNGQLEAVEMLLRAGADPHVKQSVAKGKHPKDGKTARDLADEYGWDDVAEVLRKAEANTPIGVYMRYGMGNNAKLWPMDRPEGLDPMQEKRAKQSHKAMIRPLPDKAGRKFYGEMVFGVTHGWDELGRVIRRPLLGASGPMGVEATEAAEAGAEIVATQGPRSTLGLLFPGQGSQYVGMLATAKQTRGVASLVARASEALGFDVLEFCTNGPEEQLEQTRACQPIIYVATMAAVERLREDSPEAVDRPGAVAGLSLGEYAALTVAGVFDFDTGLSLVQARALAMDEASQSPPHAPQAMLSVAGIVKETLAELCAEVSRSKGGAVCQIANELFPKGCTCAGTKEAIEALKELVDKRGALQAKVLRTPSAFHTSFMKPAREKLERALIQALPRMSPPKCDLFMNATGRVVPAGTPPMEIIPLLCDGITSVVQWESCVKNMIGSGITEYYEVGPMKQLRAMMKRLDQSAWGKTSNVEV